MLRDIIAQVAQLLTVILLAPLLQGFILRYEERVQRSLGPSLVQPYRDLRKLFRKQLVIPDTVSWIFWAAPVVAFTAMLTVPLLIPVLTNYPLPLSDMGGYSGRRLNPDARHLRHQPGGAGQRQPVRRHRRQPDGADFHPG
ncbi:NADH-quinone oxidoreductase subunit H [Acerihabitans sp. KWT182]|uniref:NADH-quinone oxidoreductase subunit H n=1 Tax=Acerihabitans sp. KWT182 TaxID=3157919 RepID=A0AAU7QFT1_9GAMM